MDLPQQQAAWKFKEISVTIYFKNTSLQRKAMNNLTLVECTQGIETLNKLEC
jgi:hypothetical protein